MEAEVKVYGEFENVDDNEAILIIDMFEEQISATVKEHEE